VAIRVLANLPKLRDAERFDGWTYRIWLAQALAELSERQRLVLGLRFVFGLDDEEIAAAIGARRGTVRSLSSRALARLRRRAEKEGQAAASEGSARNQMEVIR
jgi:RNA polymerase sigma factor (sigma-70 family)